MWGLWSGLLSHFVSASMPAVPTVRSGSRGGLGRSSPPVTNGPGSRRYRSSSGPTDRCMSTATPFAGSITEVRRCRCLPGNAPRSRGVGERPDQVSRPARALHRAEIKRQRRAAATENPRASVGETRYALRCDRPGTPCLDRNRRVCNGRPGPSVTAREAFTSIPGGLSDRPGPTIFE